MPLQKRQWSAKSLYTFYLSCRVLALKQTRTKSTGTRIISSWEMRQRLECHVLKFCYFLWFDEIQHPPSGFTKGMSHDRQDPFSQ